MEKEGEEMNKIGWCDRTWNPIIGCLNNNCPYCYARKIAKRFSKMWAMAEYDPHSYSTPSDDKTDRAVEGLSNDLRKFIPTFLYRQHHKKLPEKSQKIFVGSMSEIYYWKEKWISMVLDRIKLYPQHTFQFLTKFPDIYSQWYFHPNCWLGVTITQEEDFKQGIPYDFICSKNITFLSIEPILEKIDPNLFNELNLDWIIIGFQTNPFKKIEKESVTNIIEWTRKNNIPLFLKDSIYKGYPDLPIIKEFPKEAKQDEDNNK
ncbi:MAG: DUF5131 family protein [Ignavibacteria bacterium]|nr:DUF5131 family protein [Ignavibacteria bacterium]